MTRERVIAGSWHWTWRHGWHAEFNRWAINRPHVSVTPVGDGTMFVAVDWGNGNSDPVLSVCRENLPIPRVLAWWWDRKWQHEITRRAAARAAGRCDLCGSRAIEQVGPGVWDNGAPFILCSSCGHHCTHPEIDVFSA